MKILKIIKEAEIFIFPYKKKHLIKPRSNHLHMPECLVSNFFVSRNLVRTFCRYHISHMFGLFASSLR